jgi:glutamate-1-semialdehyde 2,1-aminomutase
VSTLADHILTKDSDWRQRAAAVIPGGMWGHQDASRLPDGFPQYFARGEGSRIWDVDGNEYIDFMCSYGPIILGHRHPAVDAAAARQLALIDCGNGPSHVVVELAETMVDTVRHADWALFAKNGTDATTVCVTVARAATRRSKVLVAQGAYHGAAPWCTPSPAGVTPEDRANLLHYRYNDLESVAAAAAQAGDELAAVVVSAFRHDVGIDQELPTPEFARGVRQLCDETGAMLVLDDVRAGFRLALGGSWEPLGVDPDLSAWSKAIANGYALAAVLGNERCRTAATRIFTTGSFWFSAVSMAASLATIEALKEADAVATVTRAGQRLRDGLAAQAAAHGQRLRQTGPPQMPMVLFDDDPDVDRGRCFTAAAVSAGVYLHPVHNWFLSTAHTDDEIDLALERTDDAFAAVHRVFGTA